VTKAVTVVEMLKLEHAVSLCMSVCVCVLLPDPSKESYVLLKYSS